MTFLDFTRLSTPKKILYDAMLKDEGASLPTHFPGQRQADRKEKEGRRPLRRAASFLPPSLAPPFVSPPPLLPLMTKGQAAAVCCAGRHALGCVLFRGRDAGLALPSSRGPSLAVVVAADDVVVCYTTPAHGMLLTCTTNRLLILDVYCLLACALACWLACLLACLPVCLLACLLRTLFFFLYSFACVVVRIY